MDKLKNKKNGKVSVVVPIYNKEKYINHSIETIRNQTYCNMEIILVDDGSTDRSPQIIDDYAGMDDRIVIVHQENAGEGAARNAGISIATGEYIIFVDADDYVERMLVERAVCAANDSNADCVVFGIYIEGENGNYRTTKTRMNNKTWTAGNKEFLYEFFTRGRENFGTSVCNKLFCLNIIKDNGLFFSDLKVGADTMFCLEYANVSKRWIRIDGFYYHYIQWGDSVMHRVDTQFEMKITELMDSYDEFARKNNLEYYLKPAIHCLDISDVFTIMKYYYRLDISMRKRVQKMKLFIQSKYCEKIISEIDAEQLTKKNKIAYIIIKNQWSYMMYLLTYIYHVIYE